MGPRRGIHRHRSLLLDRRAAWSKLDVPKSRPMAVPNDWMKKDRFYNEASTHHVAGLLRALQVAYVKHFDLEILWEFFLSALRSLGEQRASATGCARIRWHALRLRCKPASRDGLLHGRPGLGRYSAWCLVGGQLGHGGALWLAVSLGGPHGGHLPLGRRCLGSSGDAL